MIRECVEIRNQENKGSTSYSTDILQEYKSRPPHSVYDNVLNFLNLISLSDQRNNSYVTLKLFF